MNASTAAGTGGQPFVGASVPCYGQLTMKILAVIIGTVAMLIPAGLEVAAWIVRFYRRRKAASDENR